MKRYSIGATLAALVLVTAGWLCLGHAQPAATNLPPTLSIEWPRQGDGFSQTIAIKIKANAVDPDGFIAQVQFFADTNLIGVVTNPPFNLIWQVDLPWPCGYCLFEIKAVAIDDLGAKTESAPVIVSQLALSPLFPVVEIVTPRDGAIFAAPATFAFSAERLAGLDPGPVEFFVGTNSVGVVYTEFSATAAPGSVTVSNLPEGEYHLTVRDRGLDGVYCTCNRITNTIRVFNLALQTPSLAQDGRFQFEVLTSFPGRETIIGASTNLQDWIPVSTNYPSSNTFTFTDPGPATDGQRFYRVWLAPQ